MDRITEKMESVVADGRMKAAGLLEKLQREVPTDRLVQAKAVRFTPGDGAWTVIDGEQIHLPGGIEVQIKNDKFKVHQHALGQAVAKTGLIGMNTVTNLLDHREPWAHELAAHILTTTYEHTDRERMLVREVGGTVRAFLSDKFRRMDSGPLFQTFIEAARSRDCVPTNARHMETKTTLTMSLPEIFDSVPNDPLGKMMFGATLSNSDYGDGALSLKFSMLRIICKNLAMRNEVLRRVHLGARMDDVSLYSETTVELDTRTQASMIRDLVRGFLDPAKIREEINMIRAASEKDIDVTKMLATMQKKGTLTKGEQAAIAETYRTADVELLPPGNSLWRASNAISLFAQAEGLSSRRSLELQQIAGDVLDRVAA